MSMEKSMTLINKFDELLVELMGRQLRDEQDVLDNPLSCCDPETEIIIAVLEGEGLKEAVDVTLSEEYQYWKKCITEGGHRVFNEYHLYTIPKEKEDFYRVKKSEAYTPDM